MKTITQAGSVVQLPKMDGMQVAPQIFLIGEPRPVPGTNKLRCLANVNGSMCLIELKLAFN